MTDRPLLGPLLDAGVMAEVDLRVADLLTRRCGIDDPLVLDLTALLVAAQRSGHTCLDLRLVDELRDSLLVGLPVSKAGGHDTTLEDIVAALTSSPVVSGPGDLPTGRQILPLHLDGVRLHSHRSRTDETTVANGLRRLAASPVTPVADLDERLDRLFGDTGVDDPQRQAAMAFATTGLTVVVGGPGTGKTYTIARALAVLLAPGADGNVPRVAVCAPTGKAATRTKESMIEAAGTDGLTGAEADLLREVDPSTIHRLLGSLPDSRTRFRHNAEEPLAIDAVVVDETSMVSQHLLARLLESLPSGARLLLAGDPGQLESIDSGSVLRDVVDASTAGGSPMTDRVITLTDNWRVTGRSPVIDLANGIRSERPDDVIALLRAGDDRIRWIETELATGHSDEILADVIKPLTGISWSADSPEDEAALLGCLDAVGAHRLLCGHRHGPAGVSTWNRLVEEHLQVHGDWYPGRMLLVTRNEIRSGLVNGDTGVVVDTPEGRRACFRLNGRPVLLTQAQLPPTETAFALTVHKSQGSEYRQVTVVLPPGGSPLLKRELLYTAVTRATRTVTIVGSEQAIRAAVVERTIRMTGLSDALSIP